MIQIRADHPYESQIRNFFQTEFPVETEKSDSDVLELLTNAILASGKIRLGPKPNVESLYAIRQTLQSVMKNSEPVPFLMPWGSEKPRSFQTVDMAEVVAIKTLVCLQNRVQKVYPPGVHIRVRVEDATAPSLFHNRMEAARTDAMVYTESLLRLNKVLETSFIEFVPESYMVFEADFNGELEQVVPLFEDYLFASHGIPESEWEALQSYQDLMAIGWRGTMPSEQRDHYLSVYRRLYNMTDADSLKLLARYFAQSLIRRKMNMLGNKEWTDYLGLSFVGPIPGDPTSASSKRVFYRTMPENMSRLHMPPWRAKGYFRIDDGLPKVKLASWSEDRDYTPAVITLTNDNLSVSVRADYEVL